MHADILNRSGSELLGELEPLFELSNHHERPIQYLIRSTHLFQISTLIMNLVHLLQFVPGFFVQDAAEPDSTLEVWILGADHTIRMIITIVYRFLQDSGS
jgi:hypothetical protein